MSFFLSLNVSIIQPKWYNIDSFCTPFPHRLLHTLPCSRLPRNNVSSVSLLSLTRFDFGEGRGGPRRDVLNSCCTPKNTSFSGEISPISAPARSLAFCFVKKSDHDLIASEEEDARETRQILAGVSPTSLTSCHRPRPLLHSCLL